MARKGEKAGLIKVALGPDFNLPRTIHRVVIKYEEYFALALSNQSSDELVKDLCAIMMDEMIRHCFSDR